MEISGKLSQHEGKDVCLGTPAGKESEESKRAGKDASGPREDRCAES